MTQKKMQEKSTWF